VEKRTAELAKVNGELIRQIEELRQAEVALKESEDKYKQFFRTSRDCVFITSKNGSWIDMNDAAVELCGYSSREELLQVNVQNIYANPEERAKHISIVAECGFTKEFPADLLRKDGTVRHTLITSAARHDAAGNVIGFQGTIRDITERRQAEDALKESRQQLAYVIEFLPDATFVINKEGEVIAWNKAIEEMTGVKASDMLGKGNYEYALPFYGERKPMLIDLTLRSKEQILSKYDSTARRTSEIVGEAYLPQLSTGKTYIYGRASVLRDSIGNIVGAIESIRDITERKRVEEELSTKTRRLEEFNAALKVLLKQREEDRTELEESILLNVKSLIVPYVEKLKKSRLGADQMTYLTIIESHIREITSPFTKRLSKKYLGLTPAEVQAAGLIKEGKTTKEIAEALGVSENTVSSNRFHIRKKLGLTNRKVNLRYYLTSLEK
jgi:PAS domain S-box-containing protein